MERIWLVTEQFDGEHPQVVLYATEDKAYQHVAGFATEYGNGSDEIDRIEFSDTRIAWHEEDVFVDTQVIAEPREVL